VPKYSEQDLLKSNAFASRILRRYHYSECSMYQYKEDMHLEKMLALRDYARNLKRIGDASGSRDIEQEINRLPDLYHDMDTENFDHFFNPRTRN
jgi:hypothetical protein